MHADRCQPRPRWRAPPRRAVVARPPAPGAEVGALVAAPEPAKPAPAAAATKTTQRVDMTPTAAIPAEPAAKPKHKPHKKKPKDLDSPP